MLSTIPTPTGVITDIRNIQRDFLWGKGEEKKKWALVAWDRVCKPKSHGGLGLHDPGILNRVLGAKIWTWENRALVQNHSFWEIRNGNLAWFWEDNWQQEDNLRSEELADIHTDTINKGLRRVSDFWDQSKNNGKWRIWKLLDYSEMGMMHTQAIALNGLLEKRQILTSTLEDQLRWGKNKAILFTLNEAKMIDTGLNFPNTDKTWKELWDNPHWMKVKLFKWLVQ
eukprot:PITA_04124